MNNLAERILRDLSNMTGEAVYARRLAILQTHLETAAAEINSALSSSAGVDRGLRLDLAKGIVNEVLK